MEQTIIISRLLDKYEKSRHLTAPGTTGRRVMLRVEKRELPEYNYEDAAIRARYNRAAHKLERAQLVSTEWVTAKPVISSVILNLDKLEPCYALAGRTHPRELASRAVALISGRLGQAATPWIAAWRDEAVRQASQSLRIPFPCKSLPLLKDLVAALAAYDALEGRPIAMRVLSSQCFHDSKVFERELRDPFLKIAQKHDHALAEACGQAPMDMRAQLAFLGIQTQPELYALAGSCKLHTAAGIIDVAAAGSYGLELPSSAIDLITAVDLHCTQRVTFIENKTNYTAYLVSEMQPGELVVYHGGFLSAQKRRLFGMIAGAAPPETQLRFWADIDLGGFRMFTQLRELIPQLVPMRMSAESVTAHRYTGLRRSGSYLTRLRQARPEFPTFSDAIEKILEYGVTIEQESFLS